MTVGEYKGDIDVLSIDGHYRVTSSDSVPIQAHFGQLIVSNGINSDTTIQIIFGFNNGYMAYRQANYNTVAGSWNWTEWFAVATATPPQEYQLPRAEGIDGSCKYYRTQDQKCHIDGVLGSALTPILTNNKVLGTLPVGYRPIARVQRPATFLLFGGTFLAGTLFIEPNGTIITQTALDHGVNFAYFQMDF